MITKEQESQLKAKLPDWAIKQHPTKTYLSVIHPMAVIDRLNEVFGMGKWQFTTEYLSCEAFKTSNGKDSYMSAVKGRLTIPSLNIIIEQYGGSSNEDKGDALKGGGTDALTKISSYLGIGAEIYKGKGNVGAEDKLTPPFELAKNALNETETLEDLNKVHMQVKKSKLLTDDEKQKLNYQYLELAETYDPTK